MNIYHRIYKLYRRDISAQQIAATTKMPLPLVRSVIKKFVNDSKGVEIVEEESNKLEYYLDYHLDIQRKYTIVDVSGFIYDRYVDKIKIGFKELNKQNGIIAIKFDEVVDIEKDAMDLIIKTCKKFIKNNRTVVFLAPSPSVDEYILSENIEEIVKVFGTITTFDDYIIRSSHG
jgi:hypothetical protein